MTEEKDKVLRGINLEQAQLIGLQQYHDKIREEIT
jgi:hypothetical protein